MNVLRHNHPVMFDVDSTLVMHEMPVGEITMDGKLFRESNAHKFISVVDPLDDEATILVLPNEPMIRILQEELHAGKLVVVWSKGRYKWAENVLKALGIDHPNLVVMSKPDAYMDDRPCADWMGPRLYLPPTEIYKLKG